MTGQPKEKTKQLSTGWTFHCVKDSGGNPPPGGLALQFVTHQGHNFARDVRVVALWLAFEDVDASGAVTKRWNRRYTLDKDSFANVGTVQMIEPASITQRNPRDPFYHLYKSDDALGFGQYFKSGTNSFVSGATLEVFDDSLFSSLKNCPYAGLRIKQAFLFSPYSSTPSHEPAGVLEAARFHPMVHYRFVENGSHDKTKAHTRIASLRFDYRIHLFIDRHFDSFKNAYFAHLGNNAALFADRDSAVEGFAAAGIGAIPDMVNPFVTDALEKGATAATMAAIEKPLVLEVTAPALIEGFPVGKISSKDGDAGFQCWDNIHWWGTRAPGAPIISAPGGFHAAHIHWRWGAATAVAGGSDQRRYNPKVWPAGVEKAGGGMWGPLVDPAIWIQTLRFAVVRNDPEFDPIWGSSPLKLSQANWQAGFSPGLGRKPADLSNAAKGPLKGEDIVLYFSAEVHREVRLPSKGGKAASDTSTASEKEEASDAYFSKAAGTVFIHGFFFPHGPEKVQFGAGSRAPEHRPVSASKISKNKHWFRPAAVWRA